LKVRNQSLGGYGVEVQRQYLHYSDLTCDLAASRMMSANGTPTLAF
jgi:hypothetical protein